MRSLYIKILFWSFGSLALAIAGFALVSRLVFSDMVGAGGFFERINDLQLAEARETYESGGAQGLAAYLNRVNSRLGGSRYLVDAEGRDLITGENRSALVARIPSGRLSREMDGRQGFAVGSADNRYRLLILSDLPFEPRRYLFPYYLPVLLVIALWCWVLAWRIVAPLRDLSRTVDRLGRGDLSARVGSRRRDEIGKLSAAFDRMAERIEALLTGERRLLQDISHELRSPLARLNFAMELLPPASAGNSAAERIRKEVHRLTRLIDALLKSQSEGDPGTLSERVSPDDIVREVVEDCSVEADALGCRIVVEGHLDASMPGNSELLRRAIENVLRNAIRYTPGGSAVEVHLKTVGNTAEISVRDYGPGVPQEDLEKIFVPFFRVDDSRNSSTGGAGLGLTIAQRAVVLHHGHLRAENVHPGLRVTIELPLLKESWLEPAGQ